MNKDRRAIIIEAGMKLAAAREQYEAAKELIEQAKDEERDYYENMPESLQQGDRGQQADNAATLLEEAFEALDGLDFDDIDSKLEAAVE